MSKYPVICKLPKSTFLFLATRRKEETLKGLAKAKGYIRSEIGNRIRLRKTPELHFEFDESVDYGNRIESLIAELNTKDHE